MKIRPSAIIIENNKILTLKYNYNGQYLNTLPGGNVENDENIKDTLKRELFEEIKVNVQVQDLVLVAETYNQIKKSKVLHLIFKVHIIDGIPTPDSKETTAIGVEWVNLDDINNKNFYPNVTSEINQLNNVKNQTIYLGEIPQKWI